MRWPVLMLWIKVGNRVADITLEGPPEVGNMELGNVPVMQGVGNQEDDTLAVNVWAVLHVPGTWPVTVLLMVEMY